MKPLVLVVAWLGVCGSASAQWVMRPIPDAQALALTRVPLARAVVSFDAGAGQIITGELKGELCVDAMKLCAPTRSTVELLVETSGAVRLGKVTSPRPFSAWGLRFAANAPVTTGYGLQRQDQGPVEGTLAEPLELDELLVTGPVMLDVVGGKPAHLRFGTLVREQMWQGWRVPAGYRLDVRSGGQFEKTRAAKPGSVAVRVEPDPSTPAAVTMATSFSGGAQYELAAPFSIGAMSFAKGPLSVQSTDGGSADGGVQRFYQGVATNPVTLGVLRAPAGSTIEWCDGSGLQSVMTVGNRAKVGPYPLSVVRVIRQDVWVATAKGQRCAQGEARGFSFEVSLDQCKCGGAPPRAPSMVLLELTGKPLDERSAGVLSNYTPRATCPPCPRGYLP